MVSGYQASGILLYRTFHDGSFRLDIILEIWVMLFYDVKCAGGTALFTGGVRGTPQERRTLCDDSIHSDFRQAVSAAEQRVCQADEVSISQATPPARPPMDATRRKAAQAGNLLDLQHQALHKEK